MSQEPALRPRGPMSKAQGRLVRRTRLDIMDLRAIETEIGAIGPVKVSSDEFEGTAASIEEFARTGAKTLKTVRFQAENSTPGRFVRLFVMIDTESAFLTGSEDDHQVAGVEIKIEQILRSRQRRFVVACSRTIAPLVLCGSFICLMVAVVLPKTSRGSILIALTLFAALAALSLAAWTVGKFARGDIILELREVRPTWFARNRDTLIVQTLVGIVLLGVGFLLGKATS
jgi:hypothetical protein